MKIYNKIVWDKDGNVIEEDSYEYEGPITHAMGGRPKPPPPPPAPVAPPPPPPAPEPEPEPDMEAEAEAEAVAEKTKEATQRKKRSGRRGLTTGSPLGYDQPFIGNRRSLL